MRRLAAALALLLAAAAAPAQAGERADPFRQLDEVWPTPNVYRAGSGAPGHEYWQQYVHYVIEATLDDATHRLSGRARITYENRSPDSLRYLWLQLDQNRFRAHSASQLSATDDNPERMSFGRLREITLIEKNDFGYDIAAVRDAAGRPLPYRIVDTMMRIDLPEPLAPGGEVSFSIDYGFPVLPAKELSNRSAYEILKDGSPNYFIAMWYPRLAAYSDYGGWIVKAFLYGEPALEFGDFDVAITVPDNFVVAATGVLDNPDEVLSEKERRRLAAARTAEKPLFIVTPEEAKANAGHKAKGTRTWHFRAERVRDFAFAASPAFIWDAAGYRTGDGRTVLAQSLYPPEGLPLWSRYSTEAILQTFETYGRMAMDYPYPQATSINAPIRSGMEYPMIAANAPGRGEPDGTYSRRQKYGLIGVVIHEVGHNWFPMIVNSDERHWTWMDEGLNSFLDEIALRDWERDVPSLRGKPRDVGKLLTRADLRPIMTQSDAYLNRGLTAYTKVTAALNILRETILGRDLFDHAFRTYVRRWAFKRPLPADFFRSMEDASGVDLDWFWRGWFYGTDHVDIAIDKVTLATIDTGDPETEAAYKRAEKAATPRSLTDIRNADVVRRVERNPDLLDFYNEHDEFTVTPADRKAHAKLLEDLKPWEKELLSLGSKLYFIDFVNEGGLVMPLILGIDYADGTQEELRIPAEIWRRDAHRVTKLLIRDKEIASITLDPHLEDGGETKE